MASNFVRLKVLLQQRHWQTYRTFCNEYDKAAKSIDPQLVGTWPCRAQLHRWLSGDLKGLPYSDHCRILEKMFPGWTAQQLFEPCPAEPESPPERPAPRPSAAAEITQLFETVATGLEAPDSARTDWGLASTRAPAVNPQSAAVGRLPAPLSEYKGDGVDETTRELGRKLIALAKVRRLSPQETEQLAGLSGHVVELDLTVDIDIAPDGWARVSYRHDLLNLSSRPLTRLARELWFTNTRGQLAISPTNEDGRRVVIQRVNDTPNLAKFACQFSPAVQPGESAVIRYTCEGGQFVSDHYWRQALPRYTRHLTINLRHRGARQLIGCTAVEEHPDGSENSATEELLWDYDGDDVLITLTRDYLRPNQAVTVRWDVNRERASA